MDFSSLVLMEVDKENKFVGEVASYEVSEGAKYVTKFFLKNDKVNLYFDTNEDVEEWMFTAIYDLFNLEAFKEIGKIEEKDDEYNPTWSLEFSYIDDYEKMKEKVNTICELINKEINSALKEAEEKKEEYL